MSLAVSMESTSTVVDSVIENAVALTASLQRSLSEAQDSIQSYVTDQKTKANFKTQLNGRLLDQCHKLKGFECEVRGIDGKIRKIAEKKTSNGDIELKLKVKLAASRLRHDFLSLKNGYVYIHAMLKQQKIISITSFSTKRLFSRIYKYIDRTIDYIDGIGKTTSKIHSYSHQEYKAFQVQQLADIAALTDEPLNLHPNDLAFIFERVDEAPQLPTPVMQRALEHYAKCS